MKLAFQRVGKCGSSERELLMGEIAELRGEVIDLKADRIRDKAQITRLRNENWKLKRVAHEQCRGPDGTQAVGNAGNGTSEGARAEAEA